MEKKLNSRFVAHVDILGMSTLVENNFEEAWGMLSDLVHVRDEARLHEYEFVETNERLNVYQQIHIITFSDTLLLFTASDTPLELKSMIILVTEIFHKALCKCVPVRAGIAVGEFRFNLDKSMYAGPALIEAYRIGESAQWLGITLSESIQEMATSQNMRAADRNVIVEWEVPLKDDEKRGFVVNWPAIFAHDLTMNPPVSVNDFYTAFEQSFGKFDELPREIQAKYQNTVYFMNHQLESHVLG